MIAGDYMQLNNTLQVLGGAIQTKVDPESEISFVGGPTAFVNEPFNLKFAVERENVTGLPKEVGTPVRRLAAVKKTASKK